MFKKPQRKLYALIFLLPTFAAFVIGFIYPFIRGIYLSFFKFQIVNKAKFVGISNYLKAFKDESFLNSFWFTLGFVIVSVILINVMAFFIAYAHKEGRVFICRLFQRSYYDEYSSLENTIQWTFLLFVWLPALFPLHLLY